MTGESAVTSINDRSTYSLIFFRLGLVPSTRNLRKLTQPSVMRVMEWVMLKIISGLFEISAGAAKPDGDVVSHDLHGKQRERFALGRIDLARHDRGAGLVFRDLQLREACARPA